MSRQKPSFHSSRLAVACALGITLMLSGCNTLASLGLPVGKSSNNLMEAAKSISEAPGSSIALPTELAEQPLPECVISVGDTVLIEPVSFESTIRLAGDQIVKPNGMISLGEFGEFSVVGKSIEQLKLEIQALVDAQVRQRMETERAVQIATNQQRAALRTETDNSVDGAEELDEDELESRRRAAPGAKHYMALEVRKSINQNRISVRLVNWASKRFYVLGEVNSPGFYSYTGTEDVLFAITEAGGLTSKADPHQIILVRPTPCGSCKIVLKTCYNHIVQLGDTSTNYQILPGDRVFVPALTFCDDLKRSLGGAKNDRCPRCADCPRGCCLPEGCPMPTSFTAANALVRSAAEEDAAVTVAKVEDAGSKPASPDVPSVANAPPRPPLEPR